MLHKLHSLNKLHSVGLGGNKNKTVTTEVVDIELIDKLDDGSKNDGNAKGFKATFQKGVKYGKTYRFKVKSYSNGVPKNKTDIKWMIKYHSPLTSQNKWIERNLSVTGDTASITFNEKDMCGRFVYVRAYIFDDKQEGELKLWKHNRFRWLDSETLKEEISLRIDNKELWRINQAGTSLCGMGCIFYLFAKEQPKEYTKFSIELFRTGEASNKGYLVKPSNEILEKQINTEGFPLETGNMPIVDFVTLASTRNTDNPKYKGGDEQFAAINWPKFMVDMCSNFLGYKKVVDRTIPYNNKIESANLPYSEILKRIDDINTQIAEGFKLILLIDSDLIDDNWDFKSLDYHWVVLENPIQIKNYLNSNGESVYKLDFAVFTPWGGEIDSTTNRLIEVRYLKEPINFTHFIKNYYGYIKVK
mgnify:FL=1